MLARYNKIHETKFTLIFSIDGEGEGEIIEIYKTDVYKLANLSREARRDRVFKLTS